MATIDEQFDTLVQDFLSNAAAIQCPAEEYRSCLRAAQDEIAVAIQASLETS